ncbi:ABC transporter [Saitoella complicata NRRL Y-17804]|nr:ABC transporter [Saitoella complicata NRRL Y-17804]ODQ51641.1 ABC transporter [Saitoella complicata NRRL Y-17804]
MASSNSPGASSSSTAAQTDEDFTLAEPLQPYGYANILWTVPEGSSREQDLPSTTEPVVAQADEANDRPAFPTATRGSRRQDLLRRVTTADLSDGDVNHLVKVFSSRSRRSRQGQEEQEKGDNDDEEEEDPQQKELENLMGEIFNRGGNEEGKKHVGVIFKDLTVKGEGIGASTVSTFGDAMKAPFMIPKKIVGHTPQTPVRTLLDRFTGSVRDGEMLLVLGRPGSGCTTFLKTIANLREAYAGVEGDTTYGGVDAETMKKRYRGEVVYNQEDDLHYATLSVAQTLRFALKTRTPSTRAEGETRSQYIDKFQDMLLKIFGLEHVQKTKVGNELIRGVSGGEKKRVSIAEVMVNRAAVACWDNSTRGLDASTAVEYVRSLRVLTNLAKVTTIVTIYQASESLYDMFDKVLLIDEGKCAYFGPTENARQYFEELGYEPLPRQTTADFLTAVTDPRSRKIKDDAENCPKGPEALAEAYRKSKWARFAKEDIEEFENVLQTHESRQNGQEFQKSVQAGKGEHLTEKSARKSVYTVGFWGQVKACTVRQYQVAWGDKPSLIGKNFLAIFQSMIIGSLFYDTPQNSTGIFQRGGILFFALLFNALLALAELSNAFSSRPVLLKHKSFTFYRPAAYALAQVLADLPVVFVQITVYDITLYFLSGLQRKAGQFFFNFMVLYFTTMAMYSLFRMLGAITPSLDVATRISGVLIQALVVYAGYIIPRPSMKGWFVWIFYLNPVGYGFEALITNEFHNLELPCITPQLVPYGAGYGGVALANQGCTVAGSTPGTGVINGDAYLSQQFSYTWGHAWRNLGFVIMFWIAFVVITIIGLESSLKPGKAGRGEVTVYKKGGAPQAVAAAMEKGGDARDEEEAGAGQEGARAQGRDENYSENRDEEDENIQAMERNEAIFTWQHLDYIIKADGKDRKLLDDVQGWVKPGRLTALMGSSGAGKTTLLNALAQRLGGGRVTGTMLVDGHPLPISFQRSTGYVEQQDVHESTSTVREAMRFSALLRQPKDVPIEEKYDYVEKIINLLELNDIAEAVIGTIGAGLSVEQRKRVTIGVELAAKPKLLLFLDEPTSGLDSQSSFGIVKFLQKLARDAGQAILCTIHQPSAVLFENFDDLLLLEKGGKTIYFGELGKDSQTLLGYFEENGARKCPDDANPAEYMLDVIGAGATAKADKDWHEVWEQSENKKRITEEIESIISKRRGNKLDAAGDSEFAMPLWTQINAVTRRSWISYWRSPEYPIGKIMLHVLTGLFNCFTFFKLGHSTIDMQNRLFSIFIFLTISPPLIQQLQPRFLGFRAIYTAREQGSKIYSWTAFVTGAFLVELPYSVVAGTIYWCCWYWGVGFPHETSRAGFAWLLVFLFEIYYVSLGQAIAAMAPNAMLASLLVPPFFTFIIAFAGVVSPPRAFPYFWRSWMYWLTPFHYLLEAFLSTVVHDVPVRCSSGEYAQITPPTGQSCQQYLGTFVTQNGGYLNNPTAIGSTCQYCQYANGDEYTNTLNVYYYHRGRNVGIFCGYIIFNIVMIYVITWIYLGGITRFIKGLRPKGKTQEQGGGKMAETKPQAQATAARGEETEQMNT